jgi:UDP-N-acetylglucosamine diphosphorylase / glucose-1-phosphate thymidylyltransferase / UDP-N-acetylgalactosamine diphosphorylase / glucosamine-1-phosphate N-acetyltransferase / galactosamine-1-phosphate N-acetyltransferase
MKAVILAAGRATRMGELCKTIHKCMLPIAGKPLLQWNMENLSVDEFIIIVGYRKQEIMNYFGQEFQGKKITYLVQDEQKGTGHALLQAKNAIGNDENFIILMGDDWYPKTDIPNQLTIFAHQAEHAKKFGVLETKDNSLSGISEKPPGAKNKLVNIGFYILNEKIFSELEQLKESPRDELELTDAVVALAKKEKIHVKEISGWKGIAYPWELFEVNKTVLENMKNEINGTVEKCAIIKGNVIIGKNTIIKAGVYIEGPVYIGENCKIGPNCYLRNGTSIGNNCHIGNAVEIKNSIIMDNSNVPHLSYIGDSIIGRNCNLGAGTTTANLRFDNKTIKCTTKTRIDTGLRKFGAIICDNVKTGINVSLMPGIVISANSQIMPGEIVKRDIHD